MSGRLAVCAVLLGTAGGAWSQSGPLVAFSVTGDAVEAPLGGRPGDPVRGRDVVVNRNEGGCLLCHALPPSNEDERTRFMGNLAPPLQGVGSRLSAGQLRLRLIDSTRLNPDSIMPAYYRVEGLNQVAAAFRGKPLLTPQQIEDAVAYLSSLK